MDNNRQKVTIRKIEKDTIKELDFNSKDVLSAERDQKRRLIDLRKATSPHRATPRLVKIIFKSSDSDDFMMVETQELRLNENYVSLTEGCFIPLKSIYATKILL